MTTNNNLAGTISPAIKDFAKVLDVQNVRSTKNCVIYTWVSSKEQDENNNSLELRCCEDYFDKHDLTINDLQDI